MSWMHGLAQRPATGLNRLCAASAATDTSMTPAMPFNPAAGRSLGATLPIFQNSHCPLAYLWPPGSHAEPYLGAAHGLMGILYVLLHCQQWLQQDAQAINDIKDSLRLVELVFMWIWGGTAAVLASNLANMLPMTHLTQYPTAGPVLCSCESSSLLLSILYSPQLVGALLLSVHVL